MQSGAGSIVTRLDIINNQRKKNTRKRVGAVTVQRSDSRTVPRWYTWRVYMKRYGAANHTAQSGCLASLLPPVTQPTKQ